jgi:hypothetical protein
MFYENISKHKKQNMKQNETKFEINQKPILEI